MLFCPLSRSLSFSVSGHLSHPAPGSGGGAADFVQSGSSVEGGGQQPAERQLSMTTFDLLYIILLDNTVFTS